MSKIILRSAPALAALTIMLSACGGGSGDDTPQNATPVFTSASSATVNESSPLAFQARATDADGDPVSYSISGGADAARFTISSSGLVEFVEQTDFETPGSAGGSNNYQVIVSASDGKSSVTQTLTVSVQDLSLNIARIGTGFNDVAAISAIPNDTRLLVAERLGAIYIFDPATGGKTLFGNMTNVALGAEVHGMIAEPDASTGAIAQIIVSYVVGGYLTVERFFQQQVASPGTYVASRIYGAPATSHYGGWLGKAPDGSRYLLTGDLGSSGASGRIIRITDNPDPYAGATVSFFNRNTVAIGLRDPFGACLYNGALIFGDRGGSIAQEINRFNLSATSGNFGWPDQEGTSLLTTATGSGFTLPVATVPFGEGPRDGVSIVGGCVYNGAQSQFSGQYIFADASNGGVWSVPYSDFAAGRTLSSGALRFYGNDVVSDTGTPGRISYILGNGDGTLYLANESGDIFKLS